MFEAETQANYLEIERAYFYPDADRKSLGTVKVKLTNGKTFEFKGVGRGSFYRWQKAGFDFEVAPRGVEFHE
jgi:hypothetical protein